MKIVKRIAIGLGALLGLVALALVAVLLWVDPNDYRDELAARVEAATGRQLAIEGDLRLKVFPWVALEVGRVSLGNPAGFEGPPLLRAESARIGVKLLPLLQRRVEARRIVIDRPELALLTRADGSDNWSDLGSRETAPADAAAPGLAEVSIAGLDLTRGSVTLADARDGSVTRVRELSLATGELGGRAATPVELDAIVDTGEGTAATRLALAGEVGLDADAKRATLTAWTLSGERGSTGGTGATGGGAPAAGGVAATGPASPPLAFSAAGARLAYDWGTGALEPATLQARVGALPLALEVAAERLTGDRLVTGRLTIEPQDARAVAAAFGTTLPRTRAEWAFARFAARGDFRVTRDSAALEKLVATLDRSTLTGRIAIEDFAAPRLRFDLALDAIDADAYRAPVATAAAGVPADAPAAKATPSPLPVAALRALNLDGRFAIGRATLAGLALTEVTLPVAARDGALRLQPAARTFGGRYTGDLRLDAKTEALGVEMTHGIRDLDVGAALKAHAGSDRLSGRANASATLRGRGATDRALIDSFAGPIDVEVVDGALEGLDVAYELQRAQALFRRQVPAARSGPPRTPFRTLVAKSRLERGVVASDPIRVETDVLQMRGSGTFRLADQAVDYRVTTVLREVPPSDGAASLAELRAVEIPVAITGTVRDYRVRPELSEAMKARVRQEVEKRTEGARERVEEKLRERLDRLLKR